MKTKIVNNILIWVSFLCAFVLISSSSLSITDEMISELKIKIYKDIEEVSNGLAPRSKVLLETYETKSAINMDKTLISKLEEIMYGYRANPGPEGTVYFDVVDPGAIDECGDTISADFLAGGTFALNDIWYACQYGNGLLYGIDIYNDCEMWVIGGGGIGMNGLAYDPIYNKMYGSGDDNYLYEIDPDTGEQEWIGPFGSGVEYMIGMAFDADGTLYGWDLGNDALWTIDKESGEATEIGPLGIDLNYAQDGDLYREIDTLYLTAYTTTGQLYTVDKETGIATLLGDFEDGMQVTASVFLQGCPCTEHDVALKSIDYPETGPSTPDMKMQATVYNAGNNTETFDVQMGIKNYKPGEFLLDEGFEGDFPPEGWETDCWTQCNDDCSPNPPCACVYGDDQGENDSNYIISKPVNASNYTKCTLRFYFDLDTSHGGFYVLIRRNENEPWKDVTPWENPPGENQDGEVYEIGIYDFGEGCGEAIQIAWRYFGDSYYLDHIVLDSVKLYGCKTDNEYAELVEDITLEPGKTKQIEFPPWTPSIWQNESYENTWVEYLLHAFVICEGDHNPRNDEKYKLIDLYFGYFHDVGCNNINGLESGLAQTFPVTCHVKNFGQYNESGFNTYVEIAELDLDNSIELLNEDFSSSTFPPDGWTKTHNNWIYSQTSYAGGISGEAKFLYYPSSNESFRLFTPVIDTSDYESLKIEFKHYVNHYITPYNLKVEMSEDGINWETLWTIEPSGNIGPESINIVTDKNISSNVYISWTFEGNSYNINYWYVDDILIKGYCSLEPEYQTYHTVSLIEPGEELKINLSDWTPEFLQYETTVTKKYIVKGWTELVEPDDKNPDNDLFKKLITLKFYHDVVILDISSPKCHSRWPWEILYHYDDGTTIDSFGLTNGGTFEYAIRLTPDEIGLFGGEGFDSKISNIKRKHSWNNSFQMSGKIKIYKEGTATHPGDLITEEPFECIDEDWHEIVLSEPVEITGDEDIWISCEVSHESGQNPAAMDPLGPVYGKSDWLYINSEWVEAYEYGIYTDWNLRVGIDGCLPPQPFYVIDSGIQDVNITVGNFGTFPELDLSCYAEIYELITDPENLTLVYEDIITDIDLDKPVGGVKYLEFEDYNFSMEGIYVLFLKMPDKDDDNPRNNELGVSIHVDETSPYSDYPPILDPECPDGLNDWYVSDVTITLNASDPWSNGVSSGIKEIRYTVNGGAEQVIPGKTGSFVLTEDGDDILIEYWAVDRAGNVEEKKNSFTIDIDQTLPDISLSYEVSGNKWLGWKFTFLAIATDEMSGMNRVEFYLNDLIQETIVGAGPEYEWTIKYDPIQNACFKVKAFDNAGLFSIDEIVDPRIRSHSHSKIIYNFFQNFLRLYERFPILQLLFSSVDWV